MVVIDENSNFENWPNLSISKYSCLPNCLHLKILYSISVKIYVPKATFSEKRLRIICFEEMPTQFS